MSDTVWVLSTLGGFALAALIMAAIMWVVFRKHDK